MRAGEQGEAQQPTATHSPSLTSAKKRIEASAYFPGSLATHRGLLTQGSSDTGLEVRRVSTGLIFIAQSFRLKSGRAQKCRSSSPTQAC